MSELARKLRCLGHTADNRGTAILARYRDTRLGREDAGDLLCLALPGFDVLAGGTFKGEQFESGAFRFNAKQPHLRAAFRTSWALDGIGMRRGGLIGGHGGL